MKTLIYVLIIDLMLACSVTFAESASAELQSVQEHVELDYYAMRGQRFWGVAEPRLPTFAIRMVDSVPGEPTWAGACYSDKQGNSVALLIKRSDWRAQDEVGKLWLMVHELGHCLKRRDHSDAHDSIMQHIPPSRDAMLGILERMLKGDYR